MGKPKESFRVPLSDGGYLSMSVFPAEVISIQISRIVADSWTTDATLAVYRSPEGNYRQLPDREKPLKPVQS